MLSKKAKYAIKTLEFIAEHHDEEPLRIAEIADKQGFPQKFLEAILLELRKDGILRSKLGKTGGYMLNRGAKGYSSRSCHPINGWPHRVGTLCFLQILCTL
jgi:Rrf2 family protein